MGCFLSSSSRFTIEIYLTLSYKKFLYSNVKPDKQKAVNIPTMAIQKSDNSQFFEWLEKI